MSTLLFWQRLKVRTAPRSSNEPMSERDALLAKYDELLAFLAEHDGHLKLRRLMDDIRDLRDRLLSEFTELDAASSDSLSEAAS